MRTKKIIPSTETSDKMITYSGELEETEDDEKIFNTGRSVRGFTTDVKPSIQFNNNARGLVKNYMDSFIKWNNSPFCSKEQLQEIHLLISEINKYRLNDSDSIKITKNLTYLKNRMEKLKNNPTDKYIKYLLGTYGSSPDVQKTSNIYKKSKISLNNKLGEIELNKQNIKRAEFSFNKKRVFGEAAQDLANLTQLQYIQSSINTDQELQDMETAKTSLIIVLQTQIKNEMSRAYSNRKKSNKTLFISDSTKVKCQQDPVNKILDIHNLDISFGDSIKDSNAKSGIRLVVMANSDNFTLTIKITGISAKSEIFKIMVPRSIFILNLRTPHGITNKDIEYVVSSLASVSKKSSVDYYNEFVNYILSFVENLNRPRKHSIMPLVLADKNNNPTEILAFHDDTYIANGVDDRQHIAVRVYNFESFVPDAEYANEEINITTSLEISIIPRNTHNPNITFGRDNENYIKIKEYTPNSNNAKRFGTLNIVSEHRKIMENNVLFPEVSFCTIL